MFNHNVIEISDPLEMWPEQDGAKVYLIHGRQPSLHCRGIEVVDFQGCGIIRGAFVRSIWEAKGQLEQFTDISDVATAMSRSKGSICVHIFDHRTRDYYIMNDPLGGGQIYIYSNGSHSVFGSNLNSITELCAARGDKLKRDIRYFAAAVLTYTHSYGSDSPYEGVRVLRRGEYLRIHRDGHTEIFSVAPPENLYLDTRPYNDALALLRRDILENVTAPAALDYDYKVSHLTAGFDSRLVLSAMLHARVADQFLYHCINTSPDATIAKQLAGHLGLRYTPNNDGNPRGKSYQRDYIEYIHNTPRSSQLVIGDGLDSRYMPANVLVYQGGYGEVARTFNSIKWDGDISDPRKLAFTLWRWINYPSRDESPTSIWAEDFLDHVANRLLIHYQDFSRLGLPSDYFTNYLYVEGRNRIFIGARSYYASAYRSQFDPIYSTHIVSMTAGLDFERRKANFVGLDLMRLLAPELLALPFDKAKIAPLYARERGPIESLEFNGNSPEIVELVDRSDYPIPWPGTHTVVSDEDAAAARSLRIPEIVAYGLRKYGPVALDVVASDPKLRAIYNPAGLQDLAGPVSSLTRDRALRLHGMISSLVLAELIR